jgi:hypothetical protein
MRTMYFAALLAFAVPGGKAVGQSCRPADARSDRMIETLNRLMNGSKKDSLTRASLMLPIVTPSQIVLITDSTVCARAIQVLDSIIHVTNPVAPANIPPRPLYVISIGSFIAISDPNDQSDGRMAIDFFDATWKWLSGLGWRAGADPS